MKKQKLGLGKLNLSKSKIAVLNANNIKGGEDSASAFNLCYLSGPGNIIVCPITATCNTANCEHTKNGCETVDVCGSGNCPTIQDTTCIELCY